MTGGGIISGLGEVFGGLQLGSPRISDDDGDGIAIFADEVRIGGHENPNTEKMAIVTGFDRVQFGRLYVAATVIHRFRMSMVILQGLRFRQACSFFAQAWAALFNSAPLCPARLARYLFY